MTCDRFRASCLIRSMGSVDGLAGSAFAASWAAALAEGSVAGGCGGAGAGGGGGCGRAGGPGGGAGPGGTVAGGVGCCARARRPGSVTVPRAMKRAIRMRLDMGKTLRLGLGEEGIERARRERSAGREGGRIGRLYLDRSSVTRAIGPRSA